MALPTQSNVAIDATSSGGPTQPTQLPPGLTASTLPAARTSVVVQGYGTTANVTCNFATDTFLFRGDGGIWDDTQQAWINADTFGASGSPRK
jgi:hypothetical protein